MERLWSERSSTNPRFEKGGGLYATLRPGHVGENAMRTLSATEIQTFRDLMDEPALPRVV